MAERNTPFLSRKMLAFVLLSTTYASPLSKRQAAPANLTPLKSCPAANTATIIANHLGYSLCSLSQYNVPSQQWPVVANDAACALLCSQTNGCTTAVFDRTGKNCHIKGNPSAASYNFVYDNRFDAIRLAYTPTQLATITACPFGGYSYTGPDGAVYDVCPMSDYPVYSYQVIPNINSATACAALCTAQNNACKNAVYDNVYNYCHIKGTLASNVAWNVNTQFDSIKMRTPPTTKPTTTTSSTSTTASKTSTTAASFTPVDRQPITGGCPSGGSNYTTTSGATFLVCPYSDFNVANVLNQAVADINACANLCSQTSGCAFAVYEPGMCHLKGKPATPNWIQSTYYSSVQLIAPAAGSNGTSTATAACPSGTAYTSKNGITYNICPNSDYNVRNLSTVTAQDPPTCAETCSTTPGCYYVVYEPGLCHMKGAPYQPNPQSSNYYTTITVVNNTANAKAMAPKNGQWGNVIPLQVNPVAAYIVPAFPVVQKFLSFASWSATTFGGDYFNTIFGSWDLASGSQGQFNVANTQHNMFCPGMNALPDGRLVIDGGNTDDAVTIYDPFANTFTRAANMTMGRGYQSSVTTSDGKAFTIGGSFTGGIGGQNGVPMKNGEVYNPSTNKWSSLPGALVQPMLTTYDNAGAWRTDNHGWLYAWSGGSVFQAGPSKNMNWYGTSGQGSVQGAGQRNSNNDQMCGVNVMYDAGKIFSAGGSQSYSDDVSLAVAHKITINGVNQGASVQQLPNMNYARMYANAVVLPNGQVFVTGGQQVAQVFTDTQSVLQSEIWDPVSNTFTLVAPASIPRNYHSSAILLPDGRVMSGGGGLCYVGGNCNNANHADLQFYSPPYLFDANGNSAARPQVSSISSSQQSGQKVQVKPGGTLTVSLDSTNISHALVRMGSSTHSTNTDQRRISLSVQSTSGNMVTLAVPNDSGVVPPGFWYYFAVAPSGVHSIGLTVNVQI